MGMIAGLIRWAGIGVAAIMLMSFVLFVTDRSGEATKGQVNKVDARPVPVPTSTPHEPNKFRQKLDQANEQLSKPFAWITQDIGSDWARHGATALLGLLVFGLGCAWLANLLPKPKMREPTAWHT